MVMNLVVRRRKKKRRRRWMSYDQSMTRWPGTTEAKAHEIGEKLVIVWRKWKR